MKYGSMLLVFSVICVLAMADVVNVSPEILDFGEQLPGIPTSQPVVLANRTTSTLNIIVVSAYDDFCISPNSCGTALVAESQCTITVAFTPTTPGARTGTLQIVDDSGDGTHKVKLSGTGIAATSITVTPSNPTVPAGFTQQFT